MKHSNRCYVVKYNKELKRPEFEEVEGTTVRNSYDLDLFKHKLNGSKIYDVTEGRTGIKICSINPAKLDDDSNVLTHQNQIDEWLLGVNNLIDKKIRHEWIQTTIDKALVDNKYELSPRYTEPQNNKQKVIKEKNENLILAKVFYENTRKQMLKFYSENGIEFWKRNSVKDDNYFTVYIYHNKWMIPLGSNGSIDNYVQKIQGGLDVDKWLDDLYNNQISNSETWVDIAVAEYLNKIDEAKVHNEAIRKSRDEERLINEQKKQEKLKQEEKERIEKYNQLIADAELKIMNKERVGNANIETLKRTDTSLILELMRKHEIEIPLKTQGWIKKALSEIYFSAGDWTYRYFKPSANSTVFRDYLNQLIIRIECKI